jgi:hypothetical protein
LIDAAERARMQSVPLCGPRVVARLEAIGVRRLTDLRRALENLIAAAEHEAHEE